MRDAMRELAETLQQREGLLRRIGERNRRLEWARRIGGNRQTMLLE